MITAEILACSLANFFHQKAEKTHEFIINVMWQQARGDNLTICYHKKKQIEVSFSSVCSAFDNQLSPRGSTATLTTL